MSEVSFPEPPMPEDAGRGEHETVLRESSKGISTKFWVGEIRRYTGGFRKKCNFGTNGRIFKGAITERYRAPNSNYTPIFTAIKTNCTYYMSSTLIAVKVYNFPDEEHFWKSECRCLSKVEHEHPNIIPLLGICKTNCRVFLISPLVGNSTLSQNLVSPELGWSEAVCILAGVTRALHHLHGLDLCYNDLRAQNILLNEAFEPILYDFSCASAAGQKHGQLTPGYVEPIMLKEGISDGKSDVFALGLLIFQVLMKLPLTSGKDKTLMEAVHDRLSGFIHGGFLIIHPDLVATGCNEAAGKMIVELGCRCLAGERGEPPLVMKRLLPAFDMQSRPCIGEVLDTLELTLRALTSSI